MGHDDRDISEAFSRYDHDGNRILDRDEQEKMKRELEEKRVGNFSPFIVPFLKILRFSCYSVWLKAYFLLFYQNALNAELRNLTHGNKEGNAKPALSSVNQEQFQK